MNAWKPILLALALLAATPITSEGAVFDETGEVAAAAAVSSCLNPVQGDWKFGIAPKGCDPSPIDATASLLEKYESLIFDQRNEDAKERNRYTQEMHSFLRDAADYYLAQRRDDLTDLERLEWRRAVFALAHQESFWSHYRIAAEDETLKFMRGDSGFGHGILQVDERWHPNMVNTARGIDLATSVMYGLDIFFKGWERALKADCVREGNFEDRSRAAYSAYNGGPGKICRFNDAKNAWARNDKNYLKKYKQTEWIGFVADAEANAPVDLICLVEGGENCGSGVGLDNAVLWHSVSAAPLENQHNFFEAAPLFVRTASRGSRAQKNELEFV